MNYYPHHIGDFRSGTVNMSRQSRWIYRDMLDVYYDTEKPLPIDIDILCDMLGVEADEERRIVERLLRFKFTQHEDGFRHTRCDAEITAYHAKAETAKANGKLGGRPRKANQKPNKPSGFQPGSDPDAIGKQDQTGLEANQEPITNNQEPKKEQQSPPAPQPVALPKKSKSKPASLSVPDLVAHGVDAVVAEEFLALREKKRAPLSQIALDGIKREAEAVGWTLDQTLRKCVERGWQGFEAGWITKTTAGTGASRHGNFAKQDYRAGVGADGSF